MSSTNIGALIEQACESAGLSHRALADATGIPQSALSRIIVGSRAAKLPEIVSIASATGRSVAQLTGASIVADQIHCAARPANGSGMNDMRDALVHFLELNAYLDVQAIPAAHPGMA